MPTRAQDRIGRGPFAALLILLSLLLGSGSAAAAGFDIRQPAPRLGPSRGSAAVALLPSAIRNISGDEVSAAGGGAAVPPSAPGLVTRRLWARPGAEPGSRDRAPRARASNASYRARAPPAA